MDNKSGPMLCARKIVENHIAVYGMVPHPDKLKEAIASALDVHAKKNLTGRNWSNYETYQGDLVSGHSDQEIEGILDGLKSANIESVVAEFENIFGKITATERRWLVRRLAGHEV